MAKMTTPQQHAWFHAHRPDASIGSCCWCTHEAELKAERLLHDKTAEALGAFFDDPHDLLGTCMDVRGRPRKGGRPCATCDTARTALAAWKESRDEP